ncbi:MAG: molybdopterin-guanine dinucleotide biosynthesis protein B [Planctomycetaceae bacterium]|jgi:molybdopterin-guanine dinucleotide biosynthesis protein B|nr:molybdopterin-guanine dinucleotide biosynthesis protein B [Planctomycetaceae bacterium]
MDRRIHIVGRKNSGKTTLIVELVSRLTTLGYRVGTIKHTHHDHEFDTPGKDSFRHGEAGAAVVGIVGPRLTAVFESTDGFGPETDRYEAIETMFDQCDLVLVEGDLQTGSPKIEVWRAAGHSLPLSATHDSIQAVVTDDPCRATVPIFPREDIADLVNWISEIVAGPRARNRIPAAGFQDFI